MMASKNEMLPRRRVILLGASNLTRGISAVVSTVQKLWDEPLDFMIAMGHGRSYCKTSRILWRSLFGINNCTLWNDLRNREPLPVTALLTDVGNDILYGKSVSEIHESVAEVMENLANINAQTIVTELPITNLPLLGEKRFQFFKKLTYPACDLSLAEVCERAYQVNDLLIHLASHHGFECCSMQPDWYGIDPMHIKISKLPNAWPKIFSSFNKKKSNNFCVQRSLARWAYLCSLKPASQPSFGSLKQRIQPAGQLPQGSLISLY